jgi:TonB-linked SusC/RagA family outer membrane protein
MKLLPRSLKTCSLVLFKTTSLSVLLLLSAVILQGQTKSVITGTVLSSDNNVPIAGASILIKGEQIGTTSDIHGSYKISATKGQTLQFSSVSFQPKDVVIGDDNVINVLLESDGSSLQDVVVVGYGTQKKVNVTGAVTTVDVNKTFGSKPLNDPTRALQGIAPGLTITYGNGGLTTGPGINIRGIGSVNGNSRPLILVDNVETSDLSIINPNDIESVSVLKDAASTSIYGARAAFGVVLIKTKSGKRNQKTSVSYNNYFAWSKPTILPDFADPVAELTALNDASQRSGITTPEIFGMQLTKLRDGIANWQKLYAGKRTSNEMIENEDFKMESDGRMYFYRVWDPKKEMLKDYTQQQMHNIRISGGSEKIGYYVSAGYSHDGGILKMNPDDVKKYNITASINATVTKWWDVDVKMLYRNFEYEYPFAYQDYWYYIMRWGAYFPYGTWNGEYFRHTPAYMAEANKSTLSDNYQRIDLGTTFKINKHLNIRADYTLGRDNYIRHETGGPVMAWDFWSAGVPKLANIATVAQDNVNYQSGRFLVNTLNAYATYENTFFTDHNVKVTTGVNAEDYEGINFTALRRGLLDPDRGELGLATGDPTATGSHNVGAYAGYFGRITYNFRSKYLLELNARYDGSSAFSAKDRWALFTSASAGYRLGEEEFMQFLKPTVSDLKLRASYGSVGNQNVGGQYYIPAMTSSLANWVVGTTRVQTISSPIAVASSLSWENVKTLDFGADFRLFNNHIGVTVDWYERNTEGMLAPTSVPSTFGTGGPRVNSGNMRNRGIEVSVDAMYAITKDLSLYGTLAFADNKAVITKWNNPSMLLTQNYVGRTYGEIWGFETDRYFATGEDLSKLPSQTSIQNGNFVYGPGDVKYVDRNGDNIINGGKMSVNDPGDLKIIGNDQPRYQYSARLGGAYKGFDLDVYIQGVGKRDFWGLGNIAVPLYQGADILYANQLDFWTASNSNAYYPRPYIGNNATKLAGLPTTGNNFYPQTKYLLNLAYCRLKNVNIGYTLPDALLKTVKIQKLRIFLSGQNLAEISNVGVPLDPEITTGELNFLGRTFPFQRMYAFGAQLTF